MLTHIFTDRKEKRQMISEEQLKINQKCYDIIWEAETCHIAHFTHTVIVKDTYKKIPCELNKAMLVEMVKKDESLRSYRKVFSHIYAKVSADEVRVLKKYDGFYEQYIKIIELDGEYYARFSKLFESSHMFDYVVYAGRLLITEHIFTETTNDDEADVKDNEITYDSIAL